MTKYRNVKTVIDGHTFDSIAESTRYFELKQLVRIGGITDLILQPKFLIMEGYRYQGRKKQSRYYIADFEYKQDGKRIVEDVKSKHTKGLAKYTLKRDIFLSIYRQELEFLEVVY